jgi:hypothetical protein
LTTPALIIIGDNNPIVLPTWKDVLHMAGLVNSVSFAWDEIGLKVISVTALNAGGSVVDTWSIIDYFKVFIPMSLRVYEYTQTGTL